MNKRGEMNAVGGILIVAITIIVGVVLFQVISQEVGLSTSTRTLSNVSLGTMTNGTPIYLTGYKYVSDVIIFNATGDVAIPSTNYTVTNNVINPTTGDLTVRVDPGVTLAFGYDKGTATIDATAQETDYIDDASARSVASLITIFFALGIAIVALTPVLREKLLEAIGR